MKLIPAVDRLIKILYSFIPCSIIIRILDKNSSILDYLWPEASLVREPCLNIAHTKKISYKTGNISTIQKRTGTFCLVLMSTIFKWTIHHKYTVFGALTMLSQAIFFEKLQICAWISPARANNMRPADENCTRTEQRSRRVSVPNTAQAGESQKSLWRPRRH